jgi:hypothetical protein
MREARLRGIPSFFPFKKHKPIEKKNPTLKNNHINIFLKKE